ncbi:unnamed protein product [Rotaria sp. Silwood1]|nr:unnamed protein product [Rotaria sp. Silwood1]CAF4947257.1 unnamed protein product [Rotaria sp. Silwood1]
MSLTAVEYNNQANKYYLNNESLLSIESYSEAIKLIENNSKENLPLYLLYLNRSAAYIQDKNFYSGYEDAKYSLNLKNDKNFKALYHAAICLYHLGFIEESQLFIKEAIEDHKNNLIDYLNLKLLIEKKVNTMNKWRKTLTDAKQSIKHLQHIIEKKVLTCEISSILYHIRYLLRAYFDNENDKILLNIDIADLGLKLQELAVQFNAVFNVQELFMSDPLLEDLILNEMPDVGLLRIKANEQYNLENDKRDKDLKEKAEKDLAAYEFSFFVNNILSSLVVNCSDEKLSIRALKQIHRLITIDLYRRSLDNTLSNAINYIYSHSNNSFLIEKLILNNVIEILFYDYSKSSCHISVSHMIKNITVDQWKKQSFKTIQFVLKQISLKIQREDSDLLEDTYLSGFELKLRKTLHVDSLDDNIKENFNIIINVLTKIYMAFGDKQFIELSLYDPFYLFINEMWFKTFNYEQYRYNIPYLLSGFTSIITTWLKFDYSARQLFVKQIDHHISNNRQ